MAKESRRRYAINFDLTIQQLRQFVDAEHLGKAYGQITRYMEKHGFSHRQWSGYISDKILTKPELLEFTMELHKSFLLCQWIEYVLLDDDRGDGGKDE